MADVLDSSALARWRANPISFIEQVLRDPETGRPFELFGAQREFLSPAFTLTDDGRLAYPEQVFGAIKKTGKSATAGMHVLTMTLVHGGRFAEGYTVANDFEQARTQRCRARTNMATTRRPRHFSRDWRRHYCDRVRLCRCGRGQSGGVVVR